jgi:hypothetical protein
MLQGIPVLVARRCGFSRNKTPAWPERSAYKQQHQLARLTIALDRSESENPVAGVTDSGFCSGNMKNGFFKAD